MIDQCPPMSEMIQPAIWAGYGMSGTPAWVNTTYRKRRGSSTGHSSPQQNRQYTDSCI